MNLMKDNPYITITNLAEKANLSEAGIKKSLKNLKEKNLIQRVGANKNGYWMIIE